MANYRLTFEAKADLRRIYRRGVRDFGEIQADKYFDQLYQRFDEIAENPYQYQTVDYIRQGYRRSPCGVDSIYYRIIDDTVEIANIIGQQDTSEWSQ